MHVTAGNAIGAIETLDGIRRVCGIHKHVSHVNYRASKAILQMVDWLEDGVLDNFTARLATVISKFEGYDNALLNSVRESLVLLNVQFVRKLYK